MSAPVTVTVQLFARLRELAGASDVALAVPSPLSREALIEQLVAALAKDGLRTALQAPNVRLALNEELVGDELLTVAAGDRLAFLPPVTGG